MEDAGAADHAERSEELHHRVKVRIFTIAIGISLHISKITNMTDDIFGASMGNAVRVIVGTGSDTSLGQVTILMDMEAVLVSWDEAREGSGDLSS